jgi:hypothetical protein
MLKLLLLHNPFPDVRVLREIPQIIGVKRSETRDNVLCRRCQLGEYLYDRASGLIANDKTRQHGDLQDFNEPEYFPVEKERPENTFNSVGGAASRKTSDGEL